MNRSQPTSSTLRVHVLREFGCLMALAVVVAATLWLVALPPGFSLGVPITYGDGDSTQSWMWFRRILDGGWYPFPTALLGAPFGASDFDYPENEALNYLLVKALGLLSDDHFVVANLFIISGFVLAAGSAYLILRWLRVRWLWAIVGAALFAFLPYHFLRVYGGHVFLTSYWCIPVATWLALRCWPSEADARAFASRTAGMTVASAAIFVTASTGIYYAFFGCYIIIASGIAAAMARRSLRAALTAAVTVIAICAVVAAQLAPAFYYRLQYGPNPEAAVRNPAESEVYGLKITQLLLPQNDHPVDAARALALRYDRTAPLANEGWASSLGTFGSIGFLLLAATAFVRLARGGPAATDREKLALLAGAAILLGTVGGGGALFAWTVSPLIRGYNRISVYIALFCIAALVLAIDESFRRRALRSAATRALAPFAAVAVFAAGIWDQSTHFDQAPIAAEFASDRGFFAEAERALPPGTMVYQIPYRPYPESGPVHRLKDYDHFRGYLHADALHWSYGGMRGRQGDLWLRALSTRPLDEQIVLAAESGFGAVYVDRRGYDDHGAAVDAVLRTRLGDPAAVSTDGNLVLYRMTPTGSKPIPLDRAETTLADPIDLRATHLPRFVARVDGISGREAWGRWTDGRVARIQFTEPLPSRFTLELGIDRVYGPNRGRPVTVRVGEQTRTFDVGGPGKVELTFDPARPVDSIEIVIPEPTSPQSLGESSDRRALGIGLAYIRILSVP